MVYFKVLIDRQYTIIILIGYIQFNTIIVKISTPMNYFNNLIWVCI